MNNLIPIILDTNSLSHMIKKPINGVYYILWSDDKVSLVYGFLKPQEELQSGLKNLYTTESIEEFTSILLEEFNVQQIEAPYL
jgi:hypothetical protein